MRFTLPTNSVASWTSKIDFCKLQISQLALAKCIIPLGNYGKEQVYELFSQAGECYWPSLTELKLVALLYRFDSTAPANGHSHASGPKVIKSTSY